LYVDDDAVVVVVLSVNLHATTSRDRGGVRRHATWWMMRKGEGEREREMRKMGR
jgi:hypothetical protein